jgi:hypothetical protein
MQDASVDPARPQLTRPKEELVGPRVDSQLAHSLCGSSCDASPTRGRHLRRANYQMRVVGFVRGDAGLYPTELAPHHSIYKPLPLPFKRVPDGRERRGRLLPDLLPEFAAATIRYKAKRIARSRTAGDLPAGSGRLDAVNGAQPRTAAHSSNGVNSGGQIVRVRGMHICTRGKSPPRRPRSGWPSCPDDHPSGEPAAPSGLLAARAARAAILAVFGISPIRNRETRQRRGSS